MFEKPSHSLIRYDLIKWYMLQLYFHFQAQILELYGNSGKLLIVFAFKFLKPDWASNMA